MKNTQQIQAKNFFERDATNWSLKSDFKKNAMIQVSWFQGIDWFVWLADLKRMFYEVFTGMV